LEIIIISTLATRIELLLMNFAMKMSRFIALATICLLFMSMGPPSGPQGGPPSPPAGGPNPCANINCAQTT